MNEPYVKLAVTVIVVAYVGYLFVKSARSLQKSLAARKEFLRLNKKEALDFFNSYVPLCLILGACICVMLTLFVLAEQLSAKPEEIYWFRMAYLCLSLVFGGLILDAIAKRRMLLSADGFQFDEGMYRYRSIVNFEQRGTFVRVVRILMNDGKSVVVSRTMGLKIAERHEEWKARKGKKGKPGK